MLTGQGSAGGQRRPARAYTKEDAGAKSVANQKFDALFGGPAPENEESNSKTDVEGLVADALAPAG